jgi:hypothetical protein
MTQEDFAEAACCIWEEVLRILMDPEDESYTKIKDLQAKEGMAELRMNIINYWASDCHADYITLPESEREGICFDWDFAPVWVQKRVRKMTVELNIKH